MRIVADDLVEVEPEARPPVCRIMDFGKYRYDKEKKEKEARKQGQSLQMKTVQLVIKVWKARLKTSLMIPSRPMERVMTRSQRTSTERAS